MEAVQLEDGLRGASSLEEHGQCLHFLVVGAAGEEFVEHRLGDDASSQTADENVRHSFGEHPLEKDSPDFQSEIIISAANFESGDKQASVDHSVELALGDRRDFN